MVFVKVPCVVMNVKYEALRNATLRFPTYLSVIEWFTLLQLDRLRVVVLGRRAGRVMLRLN